MSNRNKIVIVIFLLIAGSFIVWRFVKIVPGATSVVEKALKARQANDVATAKRLLEEDVAKNPSDTRAKYYLAVLLSEEESFKRNYGQGADPAALAKIEQLIAGLPAADQHSAPILLLLGNIYENKGDYPKAQEEYEKALTVQKSAAGLFYLGRLKELAGDYKNAEDLYHQALSAEPNGSASAMIHLKLGQLAILVHHDPAAAEVHVKKVLDLTKDFYLIAEADHLLANMALAAKNYTLAMAYVQKALTAYPNWSRALVLKGDIELAGMSIFGMKPALDDWQKAVAVDPSLTIALWRLAKLKFVLGYVAEAQTFIDRALTAVKTDPSLREPDRNNLEKQLVELQTQIALHKK